MYDEPAANSDSYLNQFVAQGSNIISDISKKVLNTSEKQEEEFEFGLSQKDKQILDEIDSPIAIEEKEETLLAFQVSDSKNSNSNTENLLVRISEDERTTEIKPLIDFSEQVLYTLYHLYTYYITS